MRYQCFLPKSSEPCLFLFIYSFLFLVGGCGFQSDIKAIDPEQIEARSEKLIIASEGWSFEEGEISKIRLENIRPIAEVSETGEGVLVFSSDEMMQIAAEDYYRRQVERDGNTGIFWFSRGLNGVKFSIIELGQAKKSFSIEVDAVTGK